MLRDRAQHARRLAKKADDLPPLEETLAPARPGDVPELDEMWSFVARRNGSDRAS
jgi:hypothetical protein